MSLLATNLAFLERKDNHPLLAKIKRGLEKESLRVTPQGQLSHRPHPEALGATLTHPSITTDFSEALLEFITPPSTSVPEVLRILDDIHRYTYSEIGDELLWVNSMPCVLGRDDEIPLAEYGSSNIGRMKKVYREGLGNRYGRLMQTIAGIHYNWSLPDACWQILKDKAQYSGKLKDYRTEKYFALIRNFRRHFWLLLYLFGSAPVVCRSFVANRDHHLQPFNGDTHSLHMPYATSLRMGGLGYQSKAQESLVVCYNDLPTYIENLREALTKPYAEYQKTGVQDASGHYHQLNTHLLQIENEFYSTIRPKRTTKSGETPLRALWQHGVEYVEIRCVDLNPFMPVGIDAEQMYFIEVFLMHCLLSDSPVTDKHEYLQVLENQRRIVSHGRDPALKLLNQNGEVLLRNWATVLYPELEGVAALLDLNMSEPVHGEALKSLWVRIDKPEETPAAKLLSEMKTSGKSYFQIALTHARNHRDYFNSCPLESTKSEYYKDLASKSFVRKKAIEDADNIDFKTYLADFYEQYSFELKR